MSILKNKLYFILVKMILFATLMQSNEGRAEREAPATASDESYERAPISGWRFGLVTGHSPFCFGEKREFGHYRCGSYTDLTVTPPQSQGFVFKVTGNDLKATRALNETSDNTLKAWEIERIYISTFQIGRMMSLGRAKAGVAFGAGSGTISRSKAEEDEYRNIKIDEHKRTTTISVYSASLMASYVVVRTDVGDLLLDANQTWYATTEASHPRDEKRVWANMPTLAVGWSYQFE